MQRGIGKKGLGTKYQEQQEGICWKERSTVLENFVYDEYLVQDMKYEYLSVIFIWRENRSGNIKSFEESKLLIFHNKTTQLYEKGK